MIKLEQPWLQRILQAQITAYEQSRLAHALLIHGDSQLGKRALALALATRLLCSKASAKFACGQCKSCQWMAAGSHPDFSHLSFMVNERTGKLSSMIVVDQIRDLSRTFSMTTQQLGAQIAIIEPAEAMTTAAANALLKTLEEPSEARFIILVSDEPGKLPATIRSRCQKVAVRLPGNEESLDWLLGLKVPQAQANEALVAARGNPGLAFDLISNDGLSTLKQVRKDMDQLASGKLAGSEVAKVWLGDEQTAQRLRFAADLVSLTIKSRLTEGVAGEALKSQAEIPAMAQWFDEINLLRAQLPVPLRHDLILSGLLANWRSMSKTQTRVN